MNNQKPKIMHVVVNFSGGIFTFLQYLTRGLVDTYDMTVVYVASGNTPSNVRSRFDRNVQLIRLATYDPSHNPINDSTTRNELRTLYEQEKPDLIHLHGFHAGRLGRRAFEGFDVPVLYTPHGYRYLAEDRNRLTRSVFRYSEQSLANTANCTTVACSKGEFAETLGMTDNATYVNNGIDTAEIDELVKDIPQEEHELRVFTSGLINDQKNPELFNEIARAMPETRFIWIGDGETKWKLTAPNIEFTGWQEHDEAIKKMAECDVFLLTSLWEGLPIALLEAMYLKKLCVVSNVVGSRDVINNGENGYICDSAAAFVNAINHYKDEESETIREQAHQDIVEHYSLEQMLKKYDNLYSKKIYAK
ncbi:MAG: glycosyltransferase family 4 protein [Erysipelotrichaceae bacterium]|nr:glycosyltransferase family 4 protein [Erysipelotrichaceae bacterium]